MIKEAIEYLQTLVKRPETMQIKGKNYLVVPTDMDFKPILPATPNALQIGSLSGLIEYLKNSNKETELWEDNPRYLIHVVDYDQVDVISGLEPANMTRRCFISAQVHKNKFAFERFLPTESFIIAVMTNFEKTSERDELLKFVSAIKAQASREESDEGVSQSVTVKSGITTLASAVVPNPVTLIPYVTFAEVKNPVHSYVFRIKQPRTKEDPISCALFPIDSDVWKVDTIREIRDYFKSMVDDGQIDAAIIS